MQDCMNICLEIQLYLEWYIIHPPQYTVKTWIDQINIIAFPRNSWCNAALNPVAAPISVEVQNSPNLNQLLCPSVRVHLGKVNTEQIHMIQHVAIWSITLTWAIWISHRRGIYWKATPVHHLLVPTSGRSTKAALQTFGINVGEGTWIFWVARIYRVMWVLPGPRPWKFQVPHLRLLLEFANGRLAKIIQRPECQNKL